MYCSGFCVQVYYCGGINRQNTATIKTCMAYDPELNVWENSPDMKVGRNHAASCTDGTSMFVFGGRSGRNVVGRGYSDTQIFTPGQGWKYGTDMPVARGGMGKCVCQAGYCYVFGGEVWTRDAVSTSKKISSSRTVYSTDVYNIATDSWAQDVVCLCSACSCLCCRDVVSHAWLCSVSDWIRASDEWLWEHLIPILLRSTGHSVT